jgi:hypothetical protein
MQPAPAALLAAVESLGGSSVFVFIKFSLGCGCIHIDVRQRIFQFASAMSAAGFTVFDHRLPFVFALGAQVGIVPNNFKVHRVHAAVIADEVFHLFSPRLKSAGLAFNTTTPAANTGRRFALDVNASENSFFDRRFRSARRLRTSRTIQPLVAGCLWAFWRWWYWLVTHCFGALVRGGCAWRSVIK